MGRFHLESDRLLDAQLVVALIARLARPNEGSVARETDQTKLLELRGCEVGPQALERRRECRVHNFGAIARPRGHGAPDEHLDEDLHPLMHRRLRRYDAHDLYELLLEVAPLGHAFDKGAAPLLKLLGAPLPVGHRLLSHGQLLTCMLLSGRAEQLIFRFRLAHLERSQPLLGVGRA